MENAVVTFALMLPGFVTQNGVDYRCTVTKAAAHLAMIILHEPFSPFDARSQRKCLVAAKEIVADAYQIFSEDGPNLRVLFTLI